MYCENEQRFEDLKLSFSPTTGRDQQGVSSVGTLLSWSALLAPAPAAPTTRKAESESQCSR